MLGIVLGVILAIVVAILIFAATRPDTFEIKRSTSINASREKIFPMVNDLHQQSRWSPFEKDPQMKKTFSGASEGKGSVYEWSGNREVGAGRIAITDSSPPSKVVLLLEMYKPMKARNVVEFELRPAGDATAVSWSMRGRQPYLGKLVNLFIDCDKMVGRQFEDGLAKLKALAEA